MLVASGPHWLITEVGYDLIQPWRKLAARDGVLLTEGKTPIRWLMLQVAGEFVGCCGMLRLGKKVVIRGRWVRPEYRNQGWGWKLASTRMRVIEAMPGVTRVEGNALDAGALIKLGMHPDGRTYQSVGATKYVKDIVHKPPVTLAIGVMHAPWEAQRRVWAQRLLYDLKPHDHVLLCSDTQHAGVWPCARKTWLQLAAQPVTHACTIQDDMRLAAGFAHGIDQVVQAVGNHPVCGYSRKTVYFKQAEAKGGHWFLAHGVYTKIVVLPRSWIRPFVRWADAYIKPDYVHDDRRLSMFLRVHDQKVWTTVPTLGSDLGDHESLLGHNQTHANQPPLCDDVSAVDWTQGVDDPPLAAPGWVTDQHWPIMRKLDIDWHATRLPDFPP